MINGLRLAFSLLSRLPVTFPQQATNRDWGLAVLFFPLVGLVIGSALAILHQTLPTGNAVTAALLVVVWVWLTGGLHLDGLADTADGWIGGMGNRERTLAIMKDAACGPAGVTAITLTLLIKFSCLQDVSLPSWSLLLPPLAGRLAMVVMILTTPYAREQGMGSQFWQHLPRREAVVFSVVLTIFLSLFLPWPTFLLLPLALWWWRRALLDRLGGSTGDTTGAVCEGVEGLVLVVCLLAWGGN
ncbi:MAG: adenosylcobinamide-GDP ribazoletransferase [Magnetococcales bacterium]|nr:adenosylcobinamide-GDP ribazoletransferase [Magnetococcales bacterium]